MQEILQQLQQIESWQKKQIQSWIKRFQKELDEVLDVERNFYLLILAQIQAIYISNIPQAFSSLRRIRLKSQLVIFEVHLRECYFHYLQGDYQAAIKNLDIINVGRDKSSQFSKVAYDFFIRILNERKQLKGIKNKELREYQKMYLKALKSERAKNIEGAKKIQVDLFFKFGKLGPTIKYQAAKHLNLLKKKKVSGNIDDEQEFQQAISSYQKKIENKRYYEQKVNYLMSIIEIIQEPQDSETNYQLARDYILKSLQKQLQTITDQTTKTMLKQLYKTLQQESVLNQQICYKFLVDKRYQKVKQSAYQVVKKPTAVKQSSIKEIKPKSSNKMKQTDSVDFEINEPEEDFKGSNMIKINMNSGGYQERYFYVKNDFKKTKKLFYCSKKGKQTKDDDYYRLKGFNKIQFGKKSKALKRSQCDSFEEDQCFTLLIDDQQNSQRNFYVKEEEDFKNWKSIFQNLLKTVVFEDTSKIKKTIIL